MMTSTDNLVMGDDGHYILKHKTQKGKDGDCVVCGQNPKSRELTYKSNEIDMRLVTHNIENHLSRYSNHESMCPNWCGECGALIDYKIKLKTK
jgi:hypothetical protein